MSIAILLLKKLQWFHIANVGAPTVGVSSYRFSNQNRDKGGLAIEPVSGSLLCHDTEYVSQPSIILFNVELQPDAVVITPDEMQ